MKVPRFDINFYKVVTGVVFSLLWARLMYLIWSEPSFITFIWFYLGIGSVLLKWVIFKIIDKVNTAIKLRKTRRELEQAHRRVQEASKNLDILIDQQSGGKENSNKDFSINIEHLHKEVILLGNMVQKALENAVEGLKNNDAGRAREVINNDETVDHLEFSIREECLQLIASAKPEAGELRKTVTVMGIGTELERMGDYAVGIANISLMIDTRPSHSSLTSISAMKDICIEMLKGSMAAFLNSDTGLATDISSRDNEVDTLYDRAFRDLVLEMIREPGTITHITRLIWAIHNLERFADRATNICELAVYKVTGKMVDIDKSNY